MPYGRTEGAREINWENVVEIWPWILDALLWSLGQSRMGKSGRESPMMSMTVMLFFAEMRHLWMMLDRACSPGLLMTAHVFRGKGALAQEVFEV